MNSEYPFIKVTKPDKTQYDIDLGAIIDSFGKEVCVDIGRLSNNHIVLSDSQQNISRHHCSLQYQNNCWWIIDRNSSNGTFLQREINQPEIDVRSENKIALRSGNFILIPSKLSSSREPIFWRLEFIDPGETFQVFKMQAVHSLEYSLSQQTLYRNIARRKDFISLSVQQRALIDYMCRQNYQNNNQATVCEYGELIMAVWNDDHFARDREDINNLVWQVRNKIEHGAKEPQFLRTITGIGYLLDLNVVE